jgi:hypothetical protein
MKILSGLTVPSRYDSVKPCTIEKKTTAGFARRRREVPLTDHASGDGRADRLVDGRPTARRGGRGLSKDGVSPALPRN